MPKPMRILLAGLLGLALLPSAPALAACPSPYIVQPGDYLYLIAARCGVSVAAIKFANNLQGSLIFAGQALVIPGGAAGGGSGPVGSTASLPAPGSYVVKSGDTLYGLAIRFGTTVSAIRSANSLTGTILRIGQVLTIPGGTGPMVAASAASSAVSSLPASAPAAGASLTGGERLMLANYFPWYDDNFWTQGATWDLPTITYNSDQASTIQRHIGWALQAGLDGFAVHWYQSGNRTDVNLAQVLANSPAGFRSTATFLTHILPGATRGLVVDNLRYLINTYGQNPNFLRLSGRPVIFFADMDRVPPDGATSKVEAWRSIRADVDPNNASIWIAEGLDPAYLSVFDGLYIYKVDHACCPGAYTRAAAWAGWVRSWQTRTGQARLWVGTIMPGWDDTRSVGRPDLRTPSPAFARDRQGGAYYQATFNAVMASKPDLILIHSFNEWIEGSEIEPGATYGDLYLNLTRQFSSQFKGG
jgi:LysM repeat protein